MRLSCGLPIEFDGKRLIFKGIPEVRPSFRTIKEIRAVLLDGIESNDIIYEMYRDVHDPLHLALLKKYNMRYDMTIIFPRMLGREFVKTFGHYHSLSRTVAYMEAYEVLSGKAHFMLQKCGMPDVIVDAVLIEAAAGEVVIMPSGYGHVAINPARKPLVLCNLVSMNVKPDYGSIEKLRGAAYYETASGFKKNKNYKEVPELRMLRASEMKNPFFRKDPLYTAFVRQPDDFEFLSIPENHEKEALSIIA